MTAGTLTRCATTSVLALTIVLSTGSVAHAQGEEVERRGLVIRDTALVIPDDGSTARGKQNAAASPSKGCNRKLRAAIGAVIGGAAGYPLAWVAYHRFANEGRADVGSPLAAIAMGGSIAIGALVGMGSCK